MAADGLLFHLASDGSLSPFARGPHGYRTPIGPEPYIALVPQQQPAAAGCPFLPGSVAAIATGAHPGVITIDGAGRVRGEAALPHGVAPVGIALDGVGRFGYRLLVAARAKTSTTIFAIDCTGDVSSVVTGAPPLEGGIAVAPATFGRYGGDLIAPSEGTGIVYAIAPSGTATVLARSGLPHGPDIGVESAGFVPPGFGAGSGAYLSDRVSPHNPHPGTDSILSIPGSALLGAGVRPGDLLVASEGGTETIDVRCGTTCTVRHIANGPTISHGEGHIVFATPAIA